MSDPVVGEIFTAVALPMCLLILAFMFSDYVRKRDATRKAVDEAAVRFSVARDDRAAA